MRLTSPRGLPDADEKAVVVERMFDRIAPRYDRLNRVLTLGLDRRWRRRTVEALRLPPGSVAVDVACGTGDLCHELQRAGIHAVGVDLSAGMLAAARTTAPLVRADALALPVRVGSADAVTCGFALRNLPALPPFLAECARVLRRGGRLALLEVAEPGHPLLRAGHRVYFHHVVPLVGRLLSDRDAYRYLPDSTAYLPPTSELLDLVRDTGFEGVEHRLLAPGAAQLVTGARA